MPLLLHTGVQALGCGTKSQSAVNALNMSCPLAFYTDLIGAGTLVTSYVLGTHGAAGCESYGAPRTDAGTRWVGAGAPGTSA